ncbi:MAG: cob(I)yrinic acid a,c-diamide adenosyltransferase [Peptococcaceae bacterium]|jgi:cob(I)alamin adenosyltransferase|nr:cob(I)yrinic acid a,c-diamide adenosyltransferase [Peptococcaceae bacterium]
MTKHLEQGLIQIYTGNSKGKTTASFGLAVRALGHGLKVYIIQFMKGRENSGEVDALRKFAPDCQVEKFGGAGFVKKGAPGPQDLEQAALALQRAREVMQSGQWDILILDEVVNAVWFELISEAELIALLRQRPATLEMVLTGRNASATLQEQADLVTEMVQIKHPYEKGVPAREGIEY